MSNVDANDPLRDGAVEVYPRSEFIGESVVHRRYIAMADAHYGGGLVDGSYVLGLFADAATEMCIRVDGDGEGYSLRTTMYSFWPLFWSET